MLAAWSMEIGSCWIGMMRVLDKDKWFRETFEVPDNYTIIAPIALGYFDEKNIPVIERNPPEILNFPKEV
jgi:nitroreductase